jgi:hypothetical protein
MKADPTILNLRVESKVRKINAPASTVEAA